MVSSTITLSAVDHPVKSVTIFHSSTAEVTRVFTARLLKGRNTVEIAQISNKVDAESPRVHGLDSTIRVFDICCDKSIVDSKSSSRYKPVQTKHADAVDKLKAQIRELQAEQKLRQEEYDALEKSVHALMMKMVEPGDGVDRFLDHVMERKRLATKATSQIGEQITLLERELWLLSHTQRGETATKILVTFIADCDGDIEFQLTYLVSGVTWKPWYDLRAVTNDGQPSSAIELHYCANITQTTGEDWHNASLTLSTATSQTMSGLSIPTVESLRISPKASAHMDEHDYYARERDRHRSPSAPRFMPMARRSRRAHSMSRSPRRSATPESVVVDSEPLNTVTQNPLSLSYCIGGAVALPSDGLSHKISLAVLDFSAELSYVCVPRQSNAVYIQGNIKNTSEYELLAGTVSVFMDDGFVTKTSLGLISVNESFTCVLGVANALKVTCGKRLKTEQDPARNFAEPLKTVTHTVTTAVTNNHPFDVTALIVRGAIPLGDGDAKIKVMLVKPIGLAQSKEEEEVPVDLGADGWVKVRWSKVENGKGGEKDGIYEWVCGIPAGKKVLLEAVWDIRAPVAAQWEEKPVEDSAAKPSR